MSIHRRGKSNSIKELLVKIARREHLEISEGDATPFSMYATAWLERKKATLARSTYGDYRSIWKKYALPYFGTMPLCRVTRVDVEAFLGSLPEISAKRKNNWRDSGRRRRPAMGRTEAAPVGYSSVISHRFGANAPKMEARR